MDAILDAVHQEPFKEDDGAVNLDPGIEVADQFEKITLPCNEGTYINNQIDAPTREKLGFKQVKRKTYESDYMTDGSDIEEQRKVAK